MVAIEYDGLSRQVKKHIDTEAPSEPNGVGVYQYFFCDEGWEVVETLIGS